MTHAQQSSVETTTDTPTDTPEPAIPALDAAVRILHVVTESTGPLAEVAKVAVAGHLAAGHRVAVASRPEVFADLGLTETAELRHVEVPVRGSLVPGDPDHALSLHKLYRHVEVVHAHGLHAAAVAGMGLTGLPASFRPTLVASVGRFSSSSFLAKADARIVARTADAVLGTTEPVVEWFEPDVAHVERARLLKADLDRRLRPTRSKQAVRTALGVRSGTWLVASPVDLVDHGALTAIVDAAHRISTHRADRKWTVALSGHGGLRGLIAREFVKKDRGVELADQDLSVDLMAAADLVIATDRMGEFDAEDLMQLQKPVVFVGSDRGARLWGDAATHVAADDVEGLVDAIAAYIDRPALRGERAVAARRRVDDVDGGAFIAEDLRALYARLVHAKG
ncbi:glycosyltransferase [Brevibacterium litoralis]|uniref:glycosyltransferase n=1 Tax=Brevibacterium litoralis TaxID=3138935 RepID=UPI0032EC1FD6